MTTIFDPATAAGTIPGSATADAKNRMGHHAWPPSSLPGPIYGWGKWLESVSLSRDGDRGLAAKQQTAFFAGLHCGKGLDRVLSTFIDFLDWTDYPNIFTLADVFVMPAESELQSIVTLEAIASGIPPVVVNKGAVTELASAGNGLVFEPQYSNQLASNIITILSDETLRNTMKKNSLKLSKQHSMNAVGTQYEQVYEKTLKLLKNR